MKAKFFSTTIYRIRHKKGEHPLDPALEDEVNAWLRENPNVKVVHIKQSAGGGSWGPVYIFVSIWYEEGEN